MKILGIETSCDETGVCLINAKGEFGDDCSFHVLGNALHSQIATHARWGGVFPNLAKREHATALVPLMEAALKEAGELLQGRNTPALAGIRTILSREPELFEALEQFTKTSEWPDIDAIAVTQGPGLEPALWVGVNFARALSLLWDVPLVAVNHLEGHIVMAIAQEQMNEWRMRSVEFPLLALTISGGHTQLDLMREWMHYQTIGETRDDAVGEAYDKVARMLGLPYPGGPIMAKLAEAARSDLRDTTRHKFSRPMLKQDNFDFSFSGLKTEVRKHIGDESSDDDKREIALEFENAVADVLVGKTVRAAEKFGARTVVVSGGVSANSFIKQRLSEGLGELGIPLFAPRVNLATDNALMIALAGYFHLLKGDYANPETLRAEGNLRLEPKS